jgi:N-acetylneuraminic acid mutarotase
VTPRVTFQNLGPLTATFKAVFSIRNLPGTEVYRDSAFVVDLGPGATVTQSFPAWLRPHPLGDYTTRCSLAFAGDQNPGNDLAAGMFTIVLPTPGWLERASMPTPPSGKTLKDGAWLTFDQSTARVFGAKGYKTDDFYAYDPEADAWQELALIPRGIENRGPYKGAVGCATGQGVVYATRGNNTPGFLRYDASANKWQELPGVPLGPSRRKVKGGTDMAYVEKSGVGYVYLLKGYGNEFYRYNTYADSWQTMANAPAGMNQKWDKGSFLVYDGNRTLYAHKAKYHELWSYNTLDDTWSSTPLTAMPFINRQGKSRKSKDGGCAAWLSGAMYAFKGANTQELWKYCPQGDSWQEQDTIPSRGSSLRKKRIKAGADLTAYGGYVLLALKGNRCNELWRYIPATVALRDGITCSAPVVIRQSSFAIIPNPLRSGFATLRWDIAEFGSANSDRVPRLSIYDVTGRLVLHSSFVISNSSFSVDLRSMSAGVYLARLEAGGFMATQKLLIQQ